MYDVESVNKFITGDDDLYHVGKGGTGVGGGNLGKGSPSEYGFPLEPAPVTENRVPGDGLYPVPHFATFSQIVNYVSRTYRWRFEESLRDSYQNSLAMRRDPVIMHGLRMRMIPTAQLKWHLEGPDVGNMNQDEAVEGLTKLIKAIPRFQEMKMNLLEALWYGRAGSMVTYGWKNGQMTIINHRPVNGDKLVYKFDGRPGILVHPVSDVTWEVTERGRAHFFDEYEREQLILHRFEPEDSDFWEAEFGGAIAGVGLRSRLYWIWFLKQQVMAFMMDFLERVGAGGFTVYYYEAGNKQSLVEVKNAVEEQWRNNVILFPRNREMTQGGPGVERIEPSLQGSQQVFQLIDGYFDNLLRTYILGQPLTSSIGSTGFSSRVADLHDDTFNRIVNYDAISLQETLTCDLLSVLQKYNYPDSPELKFVFELQAPNAAQLMEAGKLFYDMGGELDEVDFSEALGINKPVPGNPTLSKIKDMQPQIQGAVPEGVTMAEEAGPSQQMLDDAETQALTQNSMLQQLGASLF